MKARSHRHLVITTLVSLAAAVSLGAAPASQAQAGKAAVTVTIKAEGTDLSGQVKSSKTGCKDERTVVVYRQIGSRGGGDDVRFASDTSGQQGTKYTWSTGNTGTEGKFYARVKATSQCKAAVSETIRAVRNP